MCLRTIILPDTQIISNVKPTCPGSHALKNVKCSMTVNFPKPATCSTVKNEIISRMSGDKGWFDPHNNGTYTITHNDVFHFQHGDGNQYDNHMTNTKTVQHEIKGSRVTANGQYTDLFVFSLLEDNSSESDMSEGGCVLNACSESQVFSILDFSTNYCNLRNLYCNSKDDKCPIVSYELDYEETYTNCWQRDATRCITNA